MSCSNKSSMKVIRIQNFSKLFMPVYVQSFAGYVNGSKEWEWVGKI